MAHLATAKYYGLDPLSTRIWQLLVQAQPLKNVCRQLGDEFEVEAKECERDVLEFVQKLVAAKLVEPVAA